MIRFKNSKKRCNLHVKNFQPQTTKQQLEDLFSQHGEIESIKLMPKEGEAQYAFVCYKNPESASIAKQKLHNFNFNDRSLHISHYEIKEVRQAQQEDLRDRNDFQNYQRQNLASNPSDLLSNLNKPETMNLLQMLLGMMQQRQQAPFQQNRGPNPRQQNYNNGPPRVYNQGGPQQPGAGY